MYVQYNELPNTARVWVYQSNRGFSQEEIEHISAKAIMFIDQWTRHGDDLKGSFTIKYNQFLIIAIDESFNNASGCSIDASVRFIKSLEETLQIDLMDKMNISFKDEDRINVVKLADFQGYAKEGKITEDTVVFNNLVNTKEALESTWEVSAKDSWHKRFLV
ncbi:ABC transporter ATPase [Tenacibaculum sp. M341]|uniref:ABC transporter ATPase n=1 Tax=Tenacibaculum sp. M341 TaxID=2530339 RepID=UPI00105098F3|nr:ABC transporter ATPase [Tenacibaculum sp. M341]TCI90318.1 ABC transporter ATPase [Tenacibaculum sp. M341]